MYNMCFPPKTLSAEQKNTLHVVVLRLTDCTLQRKRERFLLLSKACRAATIRNEGAEHGATLCLLLKRGSS